MIDLTKENLEEEMLKAQGYILVDLYGDGCMPCIAPTLHIHGFEEVYGKAMESCSLNITRAGGFTISRKVLGPPVITVYKNSLMTGSRVKENATPDVCEKMIEMYV